MFQKRSQLHKVKILSCLGLALVMLITGCGKEPEVRQQIELIDPVSMANINERAVRRTFYDYEVIEGNVFPVINEYPTGVGMNAADIGFSGTESKQGQHSVQRRYEGLS